MPHRNEYASKQRYKHSYFKYKDEGSNPPDERTTSNHRVKYRLPEEEHQENSDLKASILKHSYNDINENQNYFSQHHSREDSPAATVVSILPTEHESPADKERKKREFAEELRQQMASNQERKQKEKQSKLNLDYKYLSESIRANPFGRMGAGAPIRDNTGHVIANRMKMFDELSVTSFHKSFYKQKLEEDRKQQEHQQQYTQKSEIKEKQNIGEIGLQFLEWSNQEKKRKEIQRQEWKRTLDNQTENIKHKKEEEKRKRLEEDLRLEEKIKKDLQELNDEFERETGRKTNKRSGVSVGAESSVNYVVQNKRRSRKNSQYQTSSKDRSGSKDRMRDFQGLDDHDDERSHYNDFHNEINIRNLRGDIRNTEGSIERELKHMKTYSALQQQEVKQNYDSLLQLQLDMEKKHRNRKTENTDFYNTLAAENKNILGSLRSQRRNTVNYPQADYSRSFNPTIGKNASMTPYEQRYGFNNSSNFNPSIHHESVFINADMPQVNNHQHTNEVLDDLLNAYQNNTMGGNSTLGNQLTDTFTL